MQKLPFSLTTRANSPYYYVRFRNERTGKYLSWLSTKETNYNRAVRTAWNMYNNREQDIEKLSFYDSIKKASYTKEDVMQFLEDFQRKGFISGYCLTDVQKLNVPALDWLCDFWNPEKSRYLNEKLRKGQKVHKKHTMNSEQFIRKHWTELLQNKQFGELTRQDIQKQFDRLDKMELSGNTKNHILRAVLTPLKWAYNNELMPRDLSKGWVMYKAEYHKRAILTMEMARSVFRVEWTNEYSRLASMLAMCTGMRCGEILALTKDDLEDDCIHVRHSWSEKDGLKCTKNTEERTVYVAFPYIIEKLRELAETNPYPNGAGYIFWGYKPDRPTDGKHFLTYFRQALIKAGMDKETAKKMTFHAWRHFYTTYMADKVNQKALQSQTGHKSQVMLEHYAAHQTMEEAKLIMGAQQRIFGAVLHPAPCDDCQTF